MNNLAQTVRIKFIGILEINQNFIATRQMLTQDKTPHSQHLRKCLFSHWMATDLTGQRPQWPHIAKNIDYKKLLQDRQRKTSTK